MSQMHSVLCDENDMYLEIVLATISMLEVVLHKLTSLIEC